MTIPDSVGPILLARAGLENGYNLSALLVLNRQIDPPPLQPMGAAAVSPVELASEQDRVVWRYDFTLPALGNATYRLGDADYGVAADLTGDTRVAYVSCNGQENDDEGRPLDERNRLWRRLAEEHDRSAFGLLLHGGDQLYADEIQEAHPTLRAWSRADVRQKPGFEFSEETKRAAEGYLFQRYLSLYAQPDIAHLLSRVPSIMMWDDHDIIDGWGSHPAALLDSAVGKGLFDVARRMFMLFQMGATDTIAPDMSRDGVGRSLTQTAAFPGFDVIAPDLRTERRPDRVMGPDGWAAVTGALAERDPHRHLFLMSSVPLLGPRLSWIERLIGIVPKLKEYEDDLRDQWQSRAHRREWQRFLTLLEQTIVNGDGALTVLSGEIHLATRAEMDTEGGHLMRQLVAAGIAHPPPLKLYARALGWLAALGEDPLPGKRIRLKPLPGRKRIYVAERNYLVLERQGGRWSACWELEDSGRTPAMAI